MEILPKLTPIQALLLRTAARRADGRVIPPDNLRGGARFKAMTGLMRREWIEAVDGGYVLTDAGYAVAGRRRPAPPEDLQPVETPDGLHNFWRASRCAPAPNSPRWWWRCTARKAAAFSARRDLGPAAHGRPCWHCSDFVCMTAVCAAVADPHAGGVSAGGRQVEGLFTTPSRSSPP